jgi:hypothetical protein
VNPDLLLAQRVLGGLVRGCEDWPAPIAWAVGVVKTLLGSQVVIASSLGGGAYVPSTIFLPSTARLAVADPALPFGLAQRWMGCQKPSKILVDHFEQLSKRVAGAEISAMVTTELWPQAPAGVSDFLGVQHRQALGMVSVAPSLDGAHQHRLTALDPGLAQRVSSIDSIGGHVSAYAAAQLTAAVMQAAGQPETLRSLWRPCVKAPARMLAWGPRPDGGCEATDTVQVYGYTGIPSFGDVLGSTARSLNDVGAKRHAHRLAGDARRAGGGRRTQHRGTSS